MARVRKEELETKKLSNTPGSNIEDLSDIQKIMAALQPIFEQFKAVVWNLVQTVKQVFGPIFEMLKDLFSGLFSGKAQEPKKTTHSGSQSVLPTQTSNNPEPESDQDGLFLDNAQILNYLNNQARPGVSTGDLEDLNVTKNCPTLR